MSTSATIPAAVVDVTGAAKRATASHTHTRAFEVPPQSDGIALPLYLSLSLSLPRWFFVTKTKE